MIANLAKIQKIIFLIMVLIIVGLIILSVFLGIELKNANDKSIAVPVNIQEMDCDTAKTTLSKVNTDPDLIQIYNNVVVETVDGDEIVFKADESTYHNFRITSDSKIEKIVSGNVESGVLEDIKSGTKLTMITANPMDEIDYVGYEL